LEQVGLEPERVQMFNMSAAMAGEFVRVAQEMNDRITTLGPNPLCAESVNEAGDQNGENT
jgi:F420-non-reducing hydrogenase iron-sulfur subunit